MPSVRGALNFFQAPWSEISQPRAIDQAGRLRIRGPRSKKFLIRLLDACCLVLVAWRLDQGPGGLVQTLVLAAWCLELVSIGHLALRQVAARLVLAA